MSTFVLRMNMAGTSIDRSPDCEIYHVVKAALTCLVVSDVFGLSESFFKSSYQRTLNPAMLVSKSYAHTKFWRGMYVVGSTVESIDRIVFQLRNVLAQAI